VDAIAQKLVKTGREPHEKRETLRQLIRTSDGLKNAIIFCNRKRDVATLHRSLQRHGFSAVALHGDMDQQARTTALEQFRKNEVTLLVASDVAARGLDIPDVSHIFNFDVPHHPDDYVHRIGRTGRAGRSGTAVTIVTPADQKAVALIEKLIGQSIPWMDAPAREPSRERDAGSHHGRRHTRGPVTLGGPNRRPPPLARDEKVASIGNAPSRRHPQRQYDEAPPDLRHFPAFLLRPIRAAKA
jgi:superfamily II DNA/RNA helicase